MKKSYNKHLKLLADAFYANITYDDGCEFGSIGLDCKRPFGNSNVEFDILEIINMLPDKEHAVNDDCNEELYKYARELYREKLVPYLKKQWNLFKKTSLDTSTKKYGMLPHKP